MAPRVGSGVVLLVLLALACGDAGGTGGTGGVGAGGTPSCTEPTRAEDDAPTAPITTPRWAFRPWISKDISTGDDTRAFVEGFRSRDIPVGVVVLDSPWETNYNTFVPNPSRYPDFAGMVSDFRADDVRVVLWTTQMINVSSYDLEEGGDVYAGESPDRAHALACGYFVNEGEGFRWWKGEGAAIDFFDPSARAFWHRLQDPLFDMGVAGFKLDFGESYISTLPIRTDDGEKSLEAYSQAYYEDFFRYGAARLTTEEFVTMVRPYDKSYQFEGRFFARPEHAPVAWVGDNRRDYVGMLDAIDHIFRSAEAGYVVLGSDLGGYLDRDDADLLVKVPADAATFMRWTAMSAMMPFMQLHGRANLEPWSYPERTDEVLATYRYWAKLHDELVPFFDSIATQQHRGGDVRMIEPLGGEATWATTPTYLLGGALLVAPVVDGTGVRDVTLPAGARWFELLDPSAPPAAPGAVLEGVDVSDPTRIPVYVKEGAIVPMDVRDATTGFGSVASAGALTVLVYPGPAATHFDVEGEANAVEAALVASRVGGLTAIEVAPHVRDLVLRVQADALPTSVTLDGAPLPLYPTRAAFEAAPRGAYTEAGLVWIRLDAAATGTVAF